MIDWSDQVAADFRSRIIVDHDNPILAFKASRDRYTEHLHAKYAGLPYLGSRHSEDALTWNVFRSLQKAGRLDLFCDEIGLGEPLGMLLWTLAPELDDASTKLQYELGSLIRQFDGILRGQTTEPDVVIMGSRGVAVVECKLSEYGKTPSRVWDGSVGSVAKRLPIYRGVEPDMVSQGMSDAAIAPIYQLVRMAFYALRLSKELSVRAIVVSIGNEGNWNLRVRRLGRSAAELWGFFDETVTSEVRKTSTTWQAVTHSIAGSPLVQMEHYLAHHPCLRPAAA